MGPLLKLLQVRVAAPLLVGLAIASTCYGQSSLDAAASNADEAMVLRTYEIGDLVFSVPDYTLEANPTAMRMQNSSGFGGGGMGGGGGGGFGATGFAGGRGGDAAQSAGPAPLTMDSIIQVIVTTVAPDSWREGGGAGQAAALGTTLVVRQSPEAQQAIDQLLTDLRDGSASRRTITIDARWLLLDSDSLEKLTSAGEDGRLTIDRQALAEFARRPTSLRGFISCFSGQAVYLTSGTVRSNVTSYIPVVGSIEPPKPEVMFAAYPGDDGVSFVSDDQTGRTASGRSVGYQPVIVTNNFGVQIQLRPTRLHPEKAAVVDLRSTITFPGNPANVGLGDAATNDLAPKVDRIAIQTQEMATTLRVPLGEPVLVGGMTHLASEGVAAPAGTADAGMIEGAATEEQQLYLIMEVR